MSVKAWLDGDDFDLQDLTTLFAGGDIKIICDTEGYYLTSTEIDSHSADAALHSAAIRVLSYVNGIGRVNDPGFRPVRLVGRYSDDNGIHRIIVADTANFRARGSAAIATNVGGQELERSNESNRRASYTQMALPGSDVEEALAIMGQQQPLSWVEMYKIYEIIKHDVDGAIWEQAWGIKKAQLEIFNGSANHPDISGPTGRHARVAGSKPGRSMSIPQARQLISDLVDSWLDMKSR